MVSSIEQLKQQYTDQYVVVDASVPELRRFDGHVGQVKTVNMSGRALVQFDAWSNIGWYDIDPGFLKVVPKPEGADKAKVEGDKHVAPRPAVKATPAAAGGEKKLSALEMARAQGAAKGPAAPAKPATDKPAAAPAGAKKSTADILAAARAAKAASPTAPAAPAPKPAAQPPAGKMSTAEILAAARAKKAAETAPAAAEVAEATAAPSAPAAEAVVESPAAPAKGESKKPAFAPGQRPSVPEILAWCRQHDSK
jgi:hypothetical protein